jgi:hypothetical protein
VENFFNNKHILTKTRRSNAYTKLNKIKYIRLLSLFILNGSYTGKVNLYLNSVLSELNSTHWKFYSNLIVNNAGLISSNHHKSAIFSSLSNKSYRNIKNLTIYYYYNLEAMQFSLNKNIFSKILILYFCVVPNVWISSNSNFDIKTTFIWVNWYLRFNPMNNVFYLKIYNY